MPTFSNKPRYSIFILQRLGRVKEGVENIKKRLRKNSLLPYLFGNEIFDVRSVFLIPHYHLHFKTIEVQCSILSSAPLQAVSYLREGPHRLLQLIHSRGKYLSIFSRVQLSGSVCFVLHVDVTHFCKGSKLTDHRICHETTSNL